MQGNIATLSIFPDRAQQNVNPLFINIVDYDERRYNALRHKA